MLGCKGCTFGELGAQGMWLECTGGSRAHGQARDRRVGRSGGRLWLGSLLISSFGKVSQNGGLTACPSLTACSSRGCSQRLQKRPNLIAMIDMELPMTVFSLLLWICGDVIPDAEMRSCWDEVISLKPYLCGSDVFDLPKAELVARRLPVGLPETGFAAEE
ncbi:hypothetical protein CDL15_Pgr005251 [Punica granatum]|uniref:Uncharacterized protein n=1 Tax=Punica granatum TaxID=22663 RepID=A0A218WKV5_PUNGR|nr:hypothetical protein CDL15_Pgr005251 [Punica granatum]